MIRAISAFSPFSFTHIHEKSKDWLEVCVLQDIEMGNGWGRKSERRVPNKNPVSGSGDVTYVMMNPSHSFCFWFFSFSLKIIMSTLMRLIWCSGDWHRHQRNPCVWRVIQKSWEERCSGNSLIKLNWIYERFSKIRSGNEWEWEWILTRIGWIECVCAASCGESRSGGDREASHIKFCKYDRRGEDLPHCCRRRFLLFSKARSRTLNSRTTKTRHWNFKFVRDYPFWF